MKKSITMIKKTIFKNIKGFYQSKILTTYNHLNTNNHIFNLNK